MKQARRACIALISVIAVVLGFAPGAFALSTASRATKPAVVRTAAAAVHTTAVVHNQTTDPGPGYWLAADDGGVFSSGGAQPNGSLSTSSLAQPIVGITSTSTRNGYWTVASDGGVFAFGDAGFHGSTGAMHLNMPIVGMASTSSGHGYWLVASDGGVFSFGDARFHGSTGAMNLNKPIVGIAATPSGKGYWMVASDGGVFSFGDASFHGSTGAMDLNKPIVGIASTPSGKGYWMVASDGGVFSFGDASFHGSTGSIALNQPIVGLASTTTGKGYWFVARDGGVFSFGDASFFGSRLGNNQAPVVGIAPSDRVPATKLAFTTPPGAGVAGSPLVTQPVVTVQNAGGGTVMTDTSAVTLTLTNPAGANFGCAANPMTAVAGVAMFSDCTIDTVGEYTLTATDGDLAAAVSQTITVSQGATQVQFSIQPSTTATGGTAFAIQPSVTLLDADNNIAVNDGSAVTLTASGGLACTSNPVAAVDGVAHFAGCKINTSSLTPYTLTATDGSLSSDVSTGITVSVGTASQLGFTVQPGASTVSTVAFTPQPSVAVQDAGGNVVTGNTSNVVLSLTAVGNPAATLLCPGTTTTKAAVLGVAVFAGCNIDFARAYTLHAADGVLTAATSASLTVINGAPTQLGFIGQPNASTGGIAFPSQPQLAVQDNGGNTITSVNGTVALTITQPSDPGAAALTCSTNETRTITNGLSQVFAGCAIDLTSTTTYTLLATGAGGAAGLLGTSNAFAITAGVAATATFSVEPAATATVATPFTSPSVTVTDAGGNLVTSGSVTLAITAPNTPGGTLTCTPSGLTVATAGGVAVFTGCQISVGAGASYTLTATDGAATVNSTAIVVT